MVTLLQCYTKTSTILAYTFVIARSGRFNNNTNNRNSAFAATTSTISGTSSTRTSKRIINNNSLITTFISTKPNHSSKLSQTAFTTTAATTTSIRPNFGIRTTSSLSMSSSSTTTTINKKKVLVPIADGSEEIETTCIQDTLVRFGAEVTIASVKPNKELICTMSRGIKFVADCSIEDIAQNEYDLIVLPGGMPGAEYLRDCTILINMLTKQKNNNKWYGAICASPAIVLHSNNLIDNDMIVTGYPAPVFNELLKNYISSPSNPNDDRAVIVSKNLITSKGPATAILFALQLGEVLYGIDKRNEIAKQLLV